MIQIQKIVEELERRNPYADREPYHRKRKGFMRAIEILKTILSEEESRELDTDRHFLTSAYGLQCTHVNEYHMRIKHEEYDGFFDWYHTTGTLLANRNGGSTNMGKWKDAEDVAKQIQKKILT